MSLQQQLYAMAKDWPQFRPCSGHGPMSVIWFGDLKGLERSFHVSIEYGLPMCGRNDVYRLAPSVRVVRPELVPNCNAEDEAPLPHVYFDVPDIRFSRLCLFDPMAREWDPSMLISRTTVGWTVRWLAAYEFWEATGRWIGGGRHDDRATEGADHAA